MLPTAWPASLLRGLANRGRSGLRVVKLCLLLAITSIDTVCGGLLHQWQLDGTTADSVGTNHLAWDGTGSASQAYSWASGAGMRNSLAAADLGGSRRLTANLNARGAVADRDVVTFKQMTITAWFKMKSAGTSGVLWDFYNERADSLQASPRLEVASGNKVSVRSAGGTEYVAAHADVLNANAGWAFVSVAFAHNVAPSVRFFDFSGTEKAVAGGSVLTYSHDVEYYPTSIILGRAHNGGASLEAYVQDVRIYDDFKDSAAVTITRTQAVPKIISFTASNAGSTNPDRFGLAAGDKMEIVYDVATNKGLGSTTNWHQTKEQFVFNAYIGPFTGAWDADGRRFTMTAVVVQTTVAAAVTVPGVTLSVVSASDFANGDYIKIGTDRGGSVAFTFVTQINGASSDNVLTLRDEVMADAGAIVAIVGPHEYVPQQNGSLLLPDNMGLSVVSLLGKLSVRANSGHATPVLARDFPAASPLAADFIESRPIAPPQGFGAYVSLSGGSIWPTQPTSSSSDPKPLNPVVYGKVDTGGATSGDGPTAITSHCGGATFFALNPSGSPAQLFVMPHALKQFDEIDAATTEYDKEEITNNVFIPNGDHVSFNSIAGLEVTHDHTLFVVDEGDHVVYKLSQYVSLLPLQPLTAFDSSTGWTGHHSQGLHKACGISQLLPAFTLSGSCTAGATDCKLTAVNAADPGNAAFPAAVVGDQIKVVEATNGVILDVTSVPSPDTIITTVSTIGSGIVSDSSGHYAKMVSTSSGTCSGGINSWYVTDRYGMIGSSGFTDTNPEDAQFDSPQDVAVHGDGTIYIADTNNHAIRKIEFDLHWQHERVTTLAKNVYKPTGLAIGQDKTVYAVSAHSHSVTAIFANGTLATIAGMPFQQGDTAGVGKAALFNAPLRIQAHFDGTIYITDTGNHKVKRIGPDGYVSTIAGGAAGDVDGEGVIAKFNTPKDIALHPNHILFVADFANQKVKTVTMKNWSYPAIGSGAVSFSSPLYDENSVASHSVEKVNHDHVTTIRFVRDGDTTRDAHVFLSLDGPGGTALRSDVTINQAETAPTSTTPCTDTTSTACWNNFADYRGSDLTSRQSIPSLAASYNSSLPVVIYFPATVSEVFHDVLIKHDDLYETVPDYIDMVIHSPKNGVQLGAQTKASIVIRDCVCDISFGAAAYYGLEEDFKVTIDVVRHGCLERRTSVKLRLSRGQGVSIDNSFVPGYLYQADLDLDFDTGSGPTISTSSTGVPKSEPEYTTQHTTRLSQEDAHAKYVETIDTLWFEKDVSQLSFRINLRHDEEIEPEETFQLELFDSTNADLGVRYTNVSILDCCSFVNTDFDGIQRLYESDSEVPFLRAAAPYPQSEALPSLENWTVTGSAVVSTFNSPTLCWSNADCPSLNEHMDNVTHHGICADAARSGGGTRCEGMLVDPVRLVHFGAERRTQEWSLDLYDSASGQQPTTSNDIYTHKYDAKEVTSSAVSTGVHWYLSSGDSSCREWFFRSPPAYQGGSAYKGSHAWPPSHTWRSYGGYLTWEYVVSETCQKAYCETWDLDEKRYIFTLKSAGTFTQGDRVQQTVASETLYGTVSETTSNSFSLIVAVDLEETAVSALTTHFDKTGPIELTPVNNIAPDIGTSAQNTAAAGSDKYTLDVENVTPSGLSDVVISAFDVDSNEHIKKLIKKIDKTRIHAFHSIVQFNESMVEDVPCSTGNCWMNEYGEPATQAHMLHVLRHVEHLDIRGGFFRSKKHLTCDGDPSYRDLNTMYLRDYQPYWSNEQIGIDNVRWMRQRAKPVLEGCWNGNVEGRSGTATQSLEAKFCLSFKGDQKLVILTWSAPFSGIATAGTSVTQGSATGAVAETTPQAGSFSELKVFVTTGEFAAGSAVEFFDNAAAILKTTLAVSFARAHLIIDKPRQMWGAMKVIGSSCTTANDYQECTDSDWYVLVGVANGDGFAFSGKVGQRWKGDHASLSADLTLTGPATLSGNMLGKDIPDTAFARSTDCSTATLKDCSGNGFCHTDSTCTCFPAYTGDACDQLVWAIAKVTPDSGRFDGGTDVRIHSTKDMYGSLKGHFHKLSSASSSSSFSALLGSSFYECIFGDGTRVTASYISRTELSCIATAKQASMHWSVPVKVAAYGNEYLLSQQLTFHLAQPACYSEGDVVVQRSSGARGRVVRSTVYSYMIDVHVTSGAFDPNAPIDVENNVVLEFWNNLGVCEAGQKVIQAASGAVGIVAKTAVDTPYVAVLVSLGTFNTANIVHINGVPVGGWGGGLPPKRVRAVTNPLANIDQQNTTVVVTMSSACTSSCWSAGEVIKQFDSTDGRGKVLTAQGIIAETATTGTKIALVIVQTGMFVESEGVWIGSAGPLAVDEVTGISGNTTTLSGSRSPLKIQILQMPEAVYASTIFGVTLAPAISSVQVAKCSLNAVVEHPASIHNRGKIVASACSEGDTKLTIEMTAGTFSYLNAATIGSPESIQITGTSVQVTGVTPLTGSFPRGSEVIQRQQQGGPAPSGAKGTVISAHAYRDQIIVSVEQGSFDTADPILIDSQPVGTPDYVSSYHSYILVTLYSSVSLEAGSSVEQVSSGSYGTVVANTTHSNTVSVLMTAGIFQTFVFTKADARRSLPISIGSSGEVVLNSGDRLQEDNADAHTQSTNAMRYSVSWVGATSTTKDVVTVVSVNEGVGGEVRLSDGTRFKNPVATITIDGVDLIPSKIRPIAAADTSHSVVTLDARGSFFAGDRVQQGNALGAVAANTHFSYEVTVVVEDGLFVSGTALQIDGVNTGVASYVQPVSASVFTQKELFLRKRVTFDLDAVWVKHFQVGDQVVQIESGATGVVAEIVSDAATSQMIVYTRSGDFNLHVFSKRHARNFDAFGAAETHDRVVTIDGTQVDFRDFNYSVIWVGGDSAGTPSGESRAIIDVVEQSGAPVTLSDGKQFGNLPAPITVGITTTVALLGDHKLEFSDGGYTTLPVADASSFSAGDYLLIGDDYTNRCVVASDPDWSTSPATLDVYTFNRWNADDKKYSTAEDGAPVRKLIFPSRARVLGQGLVFSANNDVRQMPWPRNHPQVQYDSFHYFDILGVQPSSAPIGGSTPVTVSGHNLHAVSNANTKFMCTLDETQPSARVSATWGRDQLVTLHLGQRKSLAAGDTVEQYDSSAWQTIGAVSRTTDYSNHVQVTLVDGAVLLYGNAHNFRFQSVEVVSATTTTASTAISATNTLLVSTTTGFVQGGAILVGTNTITTITSFTTSPHTLTVDPAITFTFNDPVISRAVSDSFRADRIVCAGGVASSMFRQGLHHLQISTVAAPLSGPAFVDTGYKTASATSAAPFVEISLLTTALAATTMTSDIHLGDSVTVGSAGTYKVLKCTTSGIDGQKCTGSTLSLGPSKITYLETFVVTSSSSTALTVNDASIFKGVTKAYRGYDTLTPITVTSVTDASTVAVATVTVTAGDIIRVYTSEPVAAFFNNDAVNLVGRYGYVNSADVKERCTQHIKDQRPYQVPMWSSECAWTRPNSVPFIAYHPTSDYSITSAQYQMSADLPAVLTIDLKTISPPSVNQDSLVGSEVKPFQNTGEILCRFQDVTRGPTTVDVPGRLYDDSNPDGVSGVQCTVPAWPLHFDWRGPTDATASLVGMQRTAPLAVSVALNGVDFVRVGFPTNCGHEGANGVACSGQTDRYAGERSGCCLGPRSELLLVHPPSILNGFRPARAFSDLSAHSRPSKVTLYGYFEESLRDAKCQFSNPLKPYEKATSPFVRNSCCEGVCDVLRSSHTAALQHIGAVSVSLTTGSHSNDGVLMLNFASALSHAPVGALVMQGSTAVCDNDCSATNTITLADATGFDSGQMVYGFRSGHTTVAANVHAGAANDGLKVSVASVSGFERGDRVMINTEITKTRVITGVATDVLTLSSPVGTGGSSDATATKYIIGSRDIAGGAPEGGFTPAAKLHSSTPPNDATRQYTLESGGGTGFAVGEVVRVAKGDVHMATVVGIDVKGKVLTLSQALDSSVNWFSSGSQVSKSVTRQVVSRDGHTIVLDGFVSAEHGDIVTHAEGRVTYASATGAKQLTLTLTRGTFDSLSAINVSGVNQGTPLAMSSNAVMSGSKSARLDLLDSPSSTKTDETPIVESVYPIAGFENTPVRFKGIGLMPTSKSTFVTRTLAVAHDKLPVSDITGFFVNDIIRVGWQTNNITVTGVSSYYSSVDMSTTSSAGSTLTVLDASGFEVGDIVRVLNGGQFSVTVDDGLDDTVDNFQTVTEGIAGAAVIYHSTTIISISSNTLTISPAIPHTTKVEVRKDLLRVSPRVTARKGDFVFNERHGAQLDDTSTLMCQFSERSLSAEQSQYFVNKATVNDDSAQVAADSTLSVSTGAFGVGDHVIIAKSRTSAISVAGGTSLILSTSVRAQSSEDVSKSTATGIRYESCSATEASRESCQAKQRVIGHYESDESVLCFAPQIQANQYHDQHKKRQTPKVGSVISWKTASTQTTTAAASLTAQLTVSSISRFTTGDTIFVLDTTSGSVIKHRTRILSLGGQTLALSTTVTAQSGDTVLLCDPADDASQNPASEVETDSAAVYWKADSGSDSTSKNWIDVRFGTPVRATEIQVKGPSSSAGTIHQIDLMDVDHHYYRGVYQSDTGTIIQSDTGLDIMTKANTATFGGTNAFEGKTILKLTLNSGIPANKVSKCQLGDIINSDSSGEVGSATVIGSNCAQGDTTVTIEVTSGSFNYLQAASASNALRVKFQDWATDVIEIQQQSTCANLAGEDLAFCNSQPTPYCVAGVRIHVSGQATIQTIVLTGYPCNGHPQLEECTSVDQRMYNSIDDATVQRWGYFYSYLNRAMMSTFCLKEKGDDCSCGDITIEGRPYWVRARGELWSGGQDARRLRKFSMGLEWWLGTASSSTSLANICNWHTFGLEDGSYNNGLQECSAFDRNGFYYWARDDLLLSAFCLPEEDDCSCASVPEGIDGKAFWFRSDGRDSNCPQIWDDYPRTCQTEVNQDTYPGDDGCSAGEIQAGARGSASVCAELTLTGGGVHDTGHFLSDNADWKTTDKSAECHNFFYQEMWSFQPMSGNLEQTLTITVTGKNFLPDSTPRTSTTAGTRAIPQTSAAGPDQIMNSYVCRFKQVSSDVVKKTPAQRLDDSTLTCTRPVFTDETVPGQIIFDISTNGGITWSKSAQNPTSLGSGEMWYANTTVVSERDGFLVRNASANTYTHGNLLFYYVAITIETGQMFHVPSQGGAIIHIKIDNGLPCRATDIGGMEICHAMKYMCKFGHVIRKAEGLSNQGVYCRTPPRAKTGSYELYVQLSPNGDGGGITWTFGAKALLKYFEVRSISPAMVEASGNTIVHVYGHNLHGGQAGTGADFNDGQTGMSCLFGKVKVAAQYRNNDRPNLQELVCIAPSLAAYNMDPYSEWGMVPVEVALHDFVESHQNPSDLVTQSNINIQYFQDVCSECTGLVGCAATCPYNWTVMSVNRAQFGSVHCYNKPTCQHMGTYSWWKQRALGGETTGTQWLDLSLPMLSRGANDYQAGSHAFEEAGMDMTTAKIHPATWFPVEATCPSIAKMCMVPEGLSRPVYFADGNYVLISDASNGSLAQNAVPERLYEVQVGHEILVADGPSVFFESIIDSISNTSLRGRVQDAWSAVETYPLDPDVIRSSDLGHPDLFDDNQLNQSLVWKPTQFTSCVFHPDTLCTTIDTAELVVLASVDTTQLSTDTGNAEIASLNPTFHNTQNLKILCSKDNVQAGVVQDVDVMPNRQYNFEVIGHKGNAGQAFLYVRDITTDDLDTAPEYNCEEPTGCATGGRDIICLESHCAGTVDLPADDWWPVSISFMTSNVTRKLRIGVRTTSATMGQYFYIRSAHLRLQRLAANLISNGGFEDPFLDKKGLRCSMQGNTYTPGVSDISLQNVYRSECVTQVGQASSWTLTPSTKTGVASNDFGRPRQYDTAVGDGRSNFDGSYQDVNSKSPDLDQVLYIETDSALASQTFTTKAAHFYTASWLESGPSNVKIEFDSVDHTRDGASTAALVNCVNRDCRLENDLSTDHDPRWRKRYSNLFQATASSHTLKFTPVTTGATVLIDQVVVQETTDMAMYFDDDGAAGMSAYLQAPSSSKTSRALPTSLPYTVEVWAKPFKSGNQALVGWGQGTHLDCVMLAIVGPTVDKVGMSWTTDGPTDAQVAANKAVNWKPPHGGNTPFKGSWHHIAAVYDGTSTMLYVDGVLRSTTAVMASNFNMPTKETNVYLGGVPWGTGAWDFEGLLDEVRIWQRPLTAQQIWAVFKTPTSILNLQEMFLSDRTYIDCDQMRTCSSCQAAPGCAWCEYTGRCSDNTTATMFAATDVGKSITVVASSEASCTSGSSCIKHTHRFRTVLPDQTLDPIGTVQFVDSRRNDDSTVNFDIPYTVRWDIPTTAANGVALAIATVDKALNGSVVLADGSSFLNPGVMCLHGHIFGKQDTCPIEVGDKEGLVFAMDFNELTNDQLVADIAVKVKEGINNLVFPWDELSWTSTHHQRVQSTSPVVRPRMSSHYDALRLHPIYNQLRRGIGTTCPTIKTVFRKIHVRDRSYVNRVDTANTHQIKFNGVTYTVEWIGPQSTTATGTAMSITSVDESIGGVVALGDGTRFANPGLHQSRVDTCLGQHACIKHTNPLDCAFTAFTERDVSYGTMVTVDASALASSTLIQNGVSVVHHHRKVTDHRSGLIHELMWHPDTTVVAGTFRIVAVGEEQGGQVVLEDGQIFFNSNAAVREVASLCQQQYRQDAILSVRCG